jgi:hypothetical protein
MDLVLGLTMSSPWSGFVGSALLLVSVVVNGLANVTSLAAGGVSGTMQLGSAWRLPWSST